MVHHLFAGSNTRAGYIGFLGSLLPREDTAHVYYIKGGPGVGKSSLMRDIGRALEREDGLVEYFHCSGDPESLDAVVSHARGVILADGTAPHMLDPRLPGALDSIVDLGQCFDTRALMAARSEIDALNADVARLYARATRYLAGADAARRDTASIYHEAVERGALNSLRARLTELIPSAPEGEPRRLFAQAITCRGVLNYMDDALTGRVVSLDLPWGYRPGEILAPVISAASARAVTCSVYYDPLDAEQPSHVGFSGFTVTSCVVPDAERAALPFDAAFLRRQSSAIAFNRAAHDLLINQAVECLAQAKDKHDALERLYVDSMDFGKWERARDDIWAQIAALFPPTRTKSPLAE